jgi:hypothetical protein
MTEPEEPTFSVIVLAFSKGADDAGLVRALCEAFKFGAEDARGIIQGVPLRVKRSADRATTRHLAGQLLALGAELCISNEQTGVEKLYYPGSGYHDDDGPPSRDPAPTSGARKQVEPASGPRRSADPGASMRDALRLARQRAHGEGGAPVSARHPEGSGPISLRPLAEGAPVSARHPGGAPATISIPPPASWPPSPGPASSEPPPPPIELSPHAAPLPRPAPRKREEREAEEAAAARRKLRLRVGLAVAALLVLGGVGVVVSSLAPAPMTVELAGKTWKAALPRGFTGGEASSTSLLTELGTARMMVRTANGSGALRSCALAHLSFASPPKLEGTILERVMQHAVDELAPGGKLGPGEAVSQGKLAGRQARFAAAGGGPPFGKVRAFQVSGGDIALMLVVGNAEGAADGPEGSAWLESLAGAD